MKYYFAAFCPAKEGGYSVLFPDIPGACTQGNNLDEAMDMAADVLKVMLEEYVLARKAVPAPSSLARVREKTEKELAELGAEVPGEILYQLIAAPDLDSSPVRISISLPRNVLSLLDSKARRSGMTRSGFLADLALNA